MAHRSFRTGFHLTAERSDLGMPSMAALVDILMATMGIFVIVFALQEVVDAPTRRPAPYDVLVICRDDGTVAAHQSGQAAPTLTEPAGFAALLPGLAPEGGRFLVALSAGCAVPPTGGTAASQVLIAAFEAANRVTGEVVDVLHRYELAPLGGDGFDEPALLARWRQERGEAG